MNCRNTTTPRSQRTRWWGKAMALAALLMAGGASAQVATAYTFAQTAGSYSAISGGTLVASHTGFAAGVNSMDDQVYNLPSGTIPFSFTYDGGVYTGLNINSNGYITFGATAPSASSYTPLSATTGFTGAVSAFGRDLNGGFAFNATRTTGSADLTLVTATGPIQVGDFIAGAGIPAGATITAISGTTITMSAAATTSATNATFQAGGASWSNIRYETVGTAPNREFVIQWSGFKRFGTTAATVQHMTLNFQIRLAETTNVIRVVYNNCSPGLTTFTTVAEVGLRGPNNTFATNVNNRRNVKATNDDWVNSVVGTVNTSGMLFNNVAPANVISNGLTYSWTPPTCFGPSALSAPVITTTSADVSWAAASPAPSGGYEWEVRTTGAGGSGPTGLTTSGSTGAGVTTATTGAILTPNTTYNLYVRSNCGAGDFSAWVGPFSFFTGYCISTSTASGTFVSNFTTTGGFTNIANASGAWSATGYGDFTAQSVSQQAGGTVNFSAAFVGTTLGFAIWVDWNNNLQFELSERMFNTGAFVSSSTGSFVVPGAQALGNYRMRIRADFNASSPAVCGNIARGETEDYTFTVSAPPACAAPTALSVGSITSNSASVSFTGTSVSYNYEVRTSGAAGSGPTGLAASGTGAGSPIALGGLTDATTYTVYVQGVCAGPTTSAWSTGATFTTLCNPFNIPYTQDFSTAVAPAMPSCVTTQDVNGPSSPGGFWRTSSAATTGFTVPFAQYGYATAIGADDWLYTPGLNLTGGTSYRVSYKYAAQSTSFPEAMDVFWGNAANAAAMTNLIVDHGTFSFTTPATVQYDFTPSTTGVYYIGWHAKSGADEFNLNLDDISVTLTPTCPNPTAANLTNVTATTVDLNWTCASCSGTFVVEYGPQGYTPGTGATAGIGGTLVTSTGTSGLTITGLTGLTAYTFAVRQFCGGSDYSPNATVNGTTSLDCDAISTTISCGSSQTASWTATAGAWNVTTCGFSTPGAERLYKFTAPLSGTYTLNITAVSGSSYADWFFKPVSAGCSATGWTCIDDNNAVGTDNFTLTAGVEYYLLADPESATSTFSQTFQIDCPCKPEATRTIVADCANNQFFIDVNVTSLGTSSTVGITTDFLGDTEPTVSATGVVQIGPYPSGSSVVVTLVHENGGACNQVYTAQSFTCPPANDLCANAIAISCNSIVTGTTVGGTNTGAPATCGNYTNNATSGVWYTITGWNGPMEASLCTGTGYDSQIAVFTGSCGAFTCVAGSDDFCGSQSEVTWTGTAGTTYYIYVAGWNAAAGSFTLTTTCGSNNPVCPANGLTMEFQTDGAPFETTWEIRNGAGTVVASSGGPLVAPNGIQTENACIPDGCYTLRVLDAGGDGMTTGGYILRTQGTNQRIIDNRNNFSTGSVSAISGGQAFCLPMSAQTVLFTSCDKLDWVTGQYIVAAPNPAVSAEWIPNGANSVQDNNSGYEFWIFDPNGSYSFRRFRSHNVSDGFGPASATRACHMKINNWAVSSQIPQNTLMNVRVRTRINGVNGEFGPACRMAINPALAACPQTQLFNIPGDPDFSCGVIRQWGAGNFVFARPVSGANRYQFRFRIAAEGFEVVRTATTYFVQLNWAVLPLQNGKTYDVDVRISKDGGLTWCTSADPWGNVCQVTIGTPSFNAMAATSEIGSTKELRMFPNPNRGDVLNVSLTGIEEGVNTVSVDIFDLTGKRMSARTLAVAGNSVITTMDLGGELAAGMYVVNITAGSTSYTERLVIQP